MNEENCALKLVDEIKKIGAIDVVHCAFKLVDEIILYYVARSKKHQTSFLVSASSNVNVKAIVKLKAGPL